MAGRYFTEEMQQKLRQNPYTAKVTAGQISFTAEFKEYFWSRLQEGLSPRMILIECAYDPEILGEKRTEGLSRRIRKEGEAGEKFHTGRRAYGSAKSEGETDSDRITRLEGEVSYLKSQRDSLKRLMSAREAKQQVPS